MNITVVYAMQFGALNHLYAPLNCLSDPLIRGSFPRKEVGSDVEPGEGPFISIPFPLSLSISIPFLLSLLSLLELESGGEPIGLLS